MNLFYPKKDGTMDRAEWTDIRNYQSYGIPIFYLTGSIAGMTKDNKVTLNYIWGDRSGSCTAKWQGSSSAVLPGRYKNLSITFDTAFEAVSGWGVQKKYVLKANWVDPSHARNVVSAKLWGQMVKSRATANAKLNTLPNGGAIDGFPVIVSLNGKFHGLYTWNIPKDGWMFGMNESGKQAILCAEYNNNGATAFKGLATFEADSNGQVDFEVEFSSDDQTGWVLTAVNRLLSAVKDSDGTNIQYGITPYMDWDSAIDYYILSVLISNYDGIHRNYLLYTYDGLEFGISAYDMDVVYGNRATGKYFYPADTAGPTFSGFATNHKLFELIWTYMRPQLRERFNELVSGVLSESNVANEFTNFVHGIPLPVYVDNERLWQQIPSGASGNIAQILNFYRMRLECATEWIKDTTGEKALPEQVDPNTIKITNSLENCTTSNSITTLAKNSPYTATISANSGYELKTVIVKMGGVDITSTAYANGVVSIPSVTDDVIITATATSIVVPGYTNQVDIVGYTERTRLSSSGATKSLDYSSVTGYFPASAGDVIRIKGLNFAKDTAYICAYKNDTSKTFIGATSGTNGYTGLGEVTCDGDLATLTLPDNSDIGLVRVSAVHSTNDATWPTGMGSDEGIKGPCGRLIVTVNQEIT